MCPIGLTNGAAEWLRHPAVDWCVIPDVIGGTERENDALLSAWELPTALSVPVFHLHHSLDRLARLTDGTYPRVALGSSGGAFTTVGSRDWWSRMAEIMRTVCDAEGLPRVKIHGLGMLDPVLFSHIPFASADSCNVARNVGLDQAWTGPYVPRSKWARAIVMMDRIESHASARRWCSLSSGVQQNMEFLG